MKHIKHYELVFVKELQEDEVTASVCVTCADLK